jgi:hypothetical protein
MRLGAVVIPWSRQKVRKGSTSSDALFEHNPNGGYRVESAYVQFYKPAKAPFKTPVLLVHGGGRTGSICETTPDGRPGWLTRFLEKDIPVFVIDNVERGRAGFCAFEGEWEGTPIVRSAEEAWTMSRFGKFDAGGAKIPYPSTQFSIEALGQLSARQCRGGRVPPSCSRKRPPLPADRTNLQPGMAAARWLR